MKCGQEIYPVKVKVRKLSHVKQLTVSHVTVLWAWPKRNS